MTLTRACAVVLVALSLASVGQARHLLNASSTSTSNQTKSLLTCGEAPPNSIAPPLYSLAVAVLNATGTQNYTCTLGKYYLLGARTDLYQEEKFVGYLYTQTAKDPQPIFVFTDPTNTTILGTALTDRSVSVDVQPANSTVNAVWYRRPVLNGTGVAAGANWVVRTDVQGGAKPANSCNLSDPQDVQVPISAIYTLYACTP